MIVQINEKESIDIPISLTEVAQKFYEQAIEIEKLQEENKEWIKDAERLANGVVLYSIFTDDNMTGIIDQHNVLVEKYK